MRSERTKKRPNPQSSELWESSRRYHSTNFIVVDASSGFLGVFR